MTPPEPWPDILAAYADGELAPAARAAVERWLAAHPEARDLLRAQQELGPGNDRFWRAAEPPQPSAARWLAVRWAVGEGIPSEPPAGGWGGWRGWAAAAAVLVAAAAGLLLAFGPRLNPPVQEVAQPGAEPPAEKTRPAPPPREAVRPDPATLAASDLPDGPFVLAEDGDVEVAGVGPHPAWPGGEPRMTTAPGDTPMIYAAGVR